MEHRLLILLVIAIACRARAATNDGVPPARYNQPYSASEATSADYVIGTV